MSLWTPSFVPPFLARHTDITLVHPTQQGRRKISQTQSEEQEAFGRDNSEEHFQAQAAIAAQAVGGGGGNGRGKPANFHSHKHRATAVTWSGSAYKLHTDLVIQTNRGSPPGAILPPKGHLAISFNLFGCHKWKIDTIAI